MVVISDKTGCKTKFLLDIKKDDAALNVYAPKMYL